MKSSQIEYRLVQHCLTSLNNILFLYIRYNNPIIICIYLAFSTIFMGSCINNVIITNKLFIDDRICVNRKNEHYIVIWILLSANWIWLFVCLPLFDTK